MLLPKLGDEADVTMPVNEDAFNLTSIKTGEMLGLSSFFVRSTKFCGIMIPEKCQ